MPTLDTWEKMISAASSFAGVAQPLAALKQAGYDFGGPVAEALSRPEAVQPLNPMIFHKLKQAYGPPPPIRIGVGRAPAVPDAPPSLGGYTARASIDLQIVNDILAELWRVQTFPNQVSVSELGIGTLRSLCYGVPSGPDATIGDMVFTAPPRATAGSDNQHIQLDLAFNLPVSGTATASLTGVMHTQVLLAFETFTEPGHGKHLIVLSRIAVNLTLEVDPTSEIRPVDANSQTSLESLFTIGLELLYADNRLTFALPADYTLPGFVSGASVTVWQTGAVSLNSNGRSYLIAGTSFESDPQANPDDLVGEQLPDTPANVRLVIDQAAANAPLQALIDSGDLANLINSRAASAVAPFSLASIVVNSGHVTIGSANIAISLDCTMQGACAFGKDLGFTATISWTPQASGGTLTLANISADIDLDDVDVFVCTLLGALLGPFGILFTGIALSIAALINPSVPDQNLPLDELPPPLPGSEMVLQLNLSDATAADGELIVDGTAQLLPDASHYFIYLKLLDAGPRIFGNRPIGGAKVTLFELDNPAPAGDDVVAPPSIDTDVMKKKTEITESTTYEPTPDQFLDSQVTDANGLVRFAVHPNTIAGLYTDTTITSDIKTGDILSTVINQKVIGEALPDFGITVVNSEGVILITRQLIALNVTGNHVGTRQNPITVYLQDQLIATGGNA